MKPQELVKAKDPDLLASLQALERAAKLARKTALQTDTGIVIVQDNQIVHVSAEQLRREQSA